MSRSLIRSEHARASECRRRGVSHDIELREAGEQEDEDSQALLMRQVSNQTTKEFVTLLHAQKGDEGVRVAAKWTMSMRFEAT